MQRPRPGDQDTWDFQSAPHYDNKFEKIQNEQEQVLIRRRAKTVHPRRLPSRELGHGSFRTF